MILVCGPEIGLEKSMQMRLFPSGLIDELFATASTVEIRRMGDARYALTVSLPESVVEVAIWTTRKSRIRVAYTDALPQWITIETGAKGELDALVARGCKFHLEHCDRHFYSMSFFQAETERWLSEIIAERYIKASFIASS